MPQEIDVRRTTTASPAAVWALLDDSTTWPDWTPLDGYEIERERVPGLNEIRKFQNGRYTVREEVVEREENARLVYTLIDGLPLENYRAQIDLTPDGDGTAIRWHTTFDAKRTGTGWIYRKALDKATVEFTEGLCAAAAGSATAPAARAVPTGDG